MARIPACFWLILILCELDIDAITQDFYWRDYIQGDIPYDAIEVAPGKYIGQVPYEKHLKVATIYSYDGVAAIEYQGRINMKENIKILCAPDPSRLYWEDVDFTKNNNHQMKNTVKGGYQAVLQVPLFIGKTSNEGEWKVGKVVSITDNYSKGLWIWDKDNKLLRLLHFYIFKYNFTISGSDHTTICTT